MFRDPTTIIVRTTGVKSVTDTFGVLVDRPSRHHFVFLFLFGRAVGVSFCLSFLLLLCGGCYVVVVAMLLLKPFRPSSLTMTVFQRRSLFYCMIFHVVPACTPYHTLTRRHVARPACWPLLGSLATSHTHNTRRDTYCFVM